MESFGEFLRAQRDRIQSRTETVEQEAHIGKGSLYQYEQGRRLPNAQVASRLKEWLCKTEELKAEFDQLFARAQQAWARESPLALPIGSRDATLRVIPVPYPPFSGREDCFVDWLMKRMLELAGFRYEIAESFRDKIDRGIFDLKRRIDAVTSEEADVLINLASLERARALTFLLTPIRVSVNGLMLRKNSNLVQEARSLLAYGPLQTHVSFKILAIPNEVGWVHATRTLRVAANDIKSLGSLNTDELANALRRFALSTEPHILVCDELTAIGVLQKLNQDGLLVFQPSTDESVTLSGKRRALPAHPLGIGVRRDNHQLDSYLKEAMRIFLSFENETVAASYEELYWKLVAHIKACLACDESVYFGGVRRLPVKDLSDEFRETLLDQSARSYARRCLQLSRKALEAVPKEMEPWKPVLRRARERIRAGEARNRRRVKAVLVSALQTVVGLDPVDDRRDLDLVHFAEAVGDRWSKLRCILERDLDIQIRPELRQEILENSLEVFVSRIQRLLDGSTDRASVTAVARIDTISEARFIDLRNQYEGEFPGGEVSKGENTEIFVATNLGEAIGFIALRLDLPNRGAASVEITALFAVEHMRHEGVGSRLVRKAVEYADEDPRIESVWLSSQIPNEPKELFLHCGFRTEGDRLIYQIDRLREKRKAVGASIPESRLPRNRKQGQRS